MAGNPPRTISRVAPADYRPIAAVIAVVFGLGFICSCLSCAVCDERHVRSRRLQLLDGTEFFERGEPNAATQLHGTLRNPCLHLPLGNRVRRRLEARRTA